MSFKILRIYLDLLLFYHGGSRIPPGEGYSFTENCMEMKGIALTDWRGRASLAPPRISYSFGFSFRQIC